MGGGRRLLAAGVVLAGVGGLALAGVTPTASSETIPAAGSDPPSGGAPTTSGPTTELPLAKTSRGPAGTKPKGAATKRPKRPLITCVPARIWVPYYSPVTIHCTATKPVLRGARTLEVHFKQRTKFTATDEGDREHGANQTEARALDLLLFSSARPDDDHGAAGPLGVISARLPTRQLFRLPSHEDNATRFELQITSVDWRTAGVYSWRLFDDAPNGFQHTFNVTVGAYSPPVLSLVAPPPLKGENYRATCVAAGYFPRRSIQLRWYANDREVDFETHVTNSSSVWIDGLLTRVSTLSLPADPREPYPPNLRCEVLWYRDPVSSTRLSKIATPAVFTRPDVAVTFREGLAVCDATCVPSSGVFVTWSVDEDAPGVASQDMTTGMCADHPGLVNLRSTRPLSKHGGERAYTCVVDGYPEGLPTFSDTALYDASPEADDRPMLAGVLGIVGGVLALGLLVLITALCFYYSRPKRR
ncbi:envelope glycoprotein C [Equid herpesvirus 6]|uniref:Envelope glycoprotein C n=1 Tax=Equid herpesvirus 6 TaxID=173566 RepID=A0A7S9YX27_9ALPH|nr:envelope glycoprotein C [Equid herpesvirus 6]QPI70125.1 envelope glycoprotein C [Equid herpesvirus 6]